jgi:putative transcriptional regulator
VLVADPFLGGRYFNRSVVYMVEHNERGSVGLVLNKPLPPALASNLPCFLPGKRFRFHAGGPVETDRLCYLHRFPWIEGSHALPGGIYWGGDIEALTGFIRDGKIHPDGIRFFAGYSGWGENQLDGELKERSWVVGDIDADRLFSSPDETLWSESASAFGARYRLRAVFPADPVMN